MSTNERTKKESAYKSSTFANIMAIWLYRISYQTPLQQYCTLRFTPQILNRGGGIPLIEGAESHAIHLFLPYMSDTFSMYSENG